MPSAAASLSRDLRAGFACPPLADAPLRFSWVAAGAFAALCCWLNYPGRLNADSLFALIAATTGQANNWHSATLGWLWSVPGAWLGQPAAALLMQAVLLGLYAGFLPARTAGLRGGAAWSLELLLRVVLAGSFGFIGKDAVGLALLLIAVQLLRHALRRGWTAARTAALAAAVTLFLLIKAPNFLVLVAALALVLPFVLRARRWYGPLVVLALLAGLLAVPLNRAVDRLVFGASDVHPDKQLVIFDLAGLSLRTSHDAFARVPGWPAAALPPLADCFLPYMWDSFAPWAPCAGYSAAYDRHDAALTRRWLAELAAHPLAYAAHRLTFTNYLLRSRDQAGWGSDGAPINDARGSRGELRALMTGLHADRPIALWRPRPALAPVAWLEARLLQFPLAPLAGLTAALAVLATGWTRRHAGVRIGAIVPAALAVGNVAMLSVFGVADAARYTVPTIVLAYVALLAVLTPPAPVAD